MNKWKNEDSIQLLTLIQRKKSIQEISLIFKRTPTFIKSKLKTIAGNYYINDKPFNEIQMLTGIKKDEIIISPKEIIPKEIIPKEIIPKEINKINESIPKEVNEDPTNERPVYQNIDISYLSMFCIEFTIPTLDLIIDSTIKLRNLIKTNFNVNIPSTEGLRG